MAIVRDSFARPAPTLDRCPRIHFAAACALLWAASVAAQPATVPDEAAPDIRFEHLTNRDGLSQNTVFAIVQDRQGFMWFGTKVGLNRYDGYGFRVFTHDPFATDTMSEAFVRTIIEDQTGKLWIGTNLGGLNCFNPVTETFSHYRHDPDDPTSLSHDDVRAIHQDRSGTLWVGTQGGGLNRFDPNSGTFVHYRPDPQDPASLSHDDVRTIAEDNSGALWIGTNGRGLNRLDDDAAGGATFSHFRHDRDDPESLIDNRVRKVVADRDGILWIGTNGGLDRFDPATETFTHFRHDPADPRSLSSDRVRSLYQDRSGRLWIGTRVGLNLFDPRTESFSRYLSDPEDPQSLSGESAYSIYQDRSGGLWIGTYNGGLNRFDPDAERFVHHRHDPKDANSLSADEVNALHADAAGRLWIGTFGGGLDRLDPARQTYRHYRHDRRDPASLSDDRVGCLLEDRDRQLWVGMYNTGLSRFNAADDHFSHFRHDSEDATSLSRDYVRDLFEDQAGELWIGTQGGGLDRFDRATETFIHFRHDPEDPDSLGHDSVFAVHEDAANNLWIGTYGGGLNRLDPARESFTRFRHDPEVATSLSHDAISSIHQDRAGALWIGTYGGGLDRFDPATETFVHTAAMSTLAGNAVLGILEDRLGRLWLSTNRGLTRFDPEAERWTTYDVRDGLQDVEFNPGAYAISSEGEMFFGGNSGFNAFHPERFEDNTFVPPVVLTSFKIFEEEVRGVRASSYAEQIELSWRDNFFSFEFAALSFRRPDKNRYLYLLEGLDQDWVDAGSRRHASYTKVPPGDYVFRVKGSNNDGRWNENGASVWIRVTPPLWQTPAFYAAYALLGAGLLFAAFRLQRRRLKRHELAALQALDLKRKQAELASAEQWARELEGKNRQLEDKNQQILRTQEQLVQSEKMASLGQLVAGVAHEINNPVSFISSGLPTLRRDVDQLSDFVPEELRDPRFGEIRGRIGSLVEVIAEGARRTSDIVKNLRVFSRLDEAELKTVDLHQGLDSSLGLLQNLTRNRIQVVRNYGTLPAVQCYGSQINQVFMNLMVNAVQAIDGEGTLTITTAPAGERHVEIGIRDDGCGMSEPVKRKMFDPFFTTKPVGEGTGLGLSISHGILESHGATVEVDSRPGEGTELKITLPIAQSTASAGELAFVPPEGGKRNDLPAEGGKRNRVAEPSPVAGGLARE